MVSGVAQTCANPRPVGRCTRNIQQLTVRARRSYLQEQWFSTHKLQRAGGDHGHAVDDKRQTCCRAIVPVLGFLPGPFILACVMWAFGAIRFWKRFDRTSYMRQSRLALTALWPLLFIASPKFRSEFKKAVTSARDGYS